MQPQAFSKFQSNGARHAGRPRRGLYRRRTQWVTRALHPIPTGVNAVVGPSDPKRGMRGASSFEHALKPPRMVMDVTYWLNSALAQRVAQVLPIYLTSLCAAVPAGTIVEKPKRACPMVLEPYTRERTHTCSGSLHNVIIMKSHPCSLSSHRTCGCASCLRGRATAHYESQCASSR